MKKMMMTLMTAAMLTGAATTVFAETRIHNRKDQQQARIANGVRSGSLTARETGRIESREARLNRQVRRDRRDGGGLSARERVNIERKQDRLSRDIYRQKHDAQHR